MLAHGNTAEAMALKQARKAKNMEATIKKASSEFRESLQFRADPAERPSLESGDASYTLSINSIF